MNINSDIAKISDSLSGTSADEKDLSVLGSLFSIVKVQLKGKAYNPKRTIEKKSQQH